MQSKEIDKGPVYFAQLDGFRFLAVLAVMECHWLGVIAPLDGFIGVNLFFVISGFLITRILLISKEKYGPEFLRPIRTFYWRRTLRIFPIYYLVILLLVIVSAPYARHDIYWLLTYTYNIKLAIVNAYVHTNGIWLYPHFWSLCVEEQFYLFLPALIFLFNITNIKKMIYVLILSGVLSRVCFAFVNPTCQLTLFTDCLDAFGFGALIGYSMLYEKEWLSKLMSKNYVFLIFSVLYTVFVIVAKLHDFKYNAIFCVLDKLLFSICAFWIVGKAALTSYTGLFKSFIENKAVVYLGKISYGIYLYHFFVGRLLSYDSLFYLYKKLDPPVFGDYLWRGLLKYCPSMYGNWLYGFCCYFVITIIVASLSWHLIELPISKLKEKYSSK